MTVKYKLSEVAKDLKVANKDVIDLLTEKVGGEVRKAATVLTEDELNLVFEHYTKANQVENFDGYFATKDEKPAPKEEPKKETEPVKQEEPKIAEKPVATPVPQSTPKVEQKPAPAQSATPVQAAPVRPAQPVQNTPTQNTSGQNQNAQFSRPAPNTPRPAQGSGTGQNVPRASNGLRPNTNTRPAQPGQPVQSGQQSQSSFVQPPRANRFENKPQFDNKPKPAPQNKPRPTQPNPLAAQNQPAATGAVSTEPVEKERTVRHVDTKTVDVNLDKYNERYEEIAPQNRVKDGQKKQKLKQKSQVKNKAKFSSKKETEAEKLQRMALERARKQQLKVMIPEEIMVSELAIRLKVTVTDVIKKLMQMGVMAAQHELIDFDTASLVAMEYDAKVEKEVVVTIEEKLIKDLEDTSDNLTARSPVVVVMGHVDHGKTSLLDRIRNAKVTATEAGGITQHIGAYQVQVGERDVTFLDTPGHEAFTSMRARGAAVTDIAILVVAADDGIMPQTVEAINHAKAAGVSIIVAINKMDKPQANADKVMQELTSYDLVPEEWGGDIICVPVSAVTGEGIDNLLENILLVAEIQDLKANPNRQAKGTVVEARLDKGRGPVATLLVQNGTLRTGDIIIAGTSVGRVRQMVNDLGQVVEEAGPSVPVEITGMAEVPAAGDTFNAVKDERLARELVEQRRHEQKEEQFQSIQKVTLDNLFSQIAEGEMKELPLIVKADVQGSAEAVKQSLEKLTNEEVRVRVIHAGVGAVSNSDIMLAGAAGAIIIGFNVRPDPVIKMDADEAGVEMRMYRIIYDAIEEIKDAMKGMLDPKTREVELGRVEVRQVYKITNVGTIAGCYVLDGKIVRDALLRVVRDGIVVAEDKIDSLKRFKNDAKEVAQGYECGVGLTKFNDIKEGDIFESFIIEEYRD